jgi:hypothetical protein
VYHYRLNFKAPADSLISRPHENRSLVLFAVALQVGMGAATAGAMASLFDAGGVAGGVFAGVATDNLLGG